ncbi:MAG: serine hydrolase [Candidatus Latescibacteria bacterium]|nr:serine hydrolase [Candidatus Latescibacterota bacterium]
MMDPVKQAVYRVLAAVLLFQASIVSAVDGSDGPVDRAELAAFIDSLIMSEMEALHIPGAAVSVVHRGTVLVSKGYGYARLDGKRAVEPDKTTFYLGSVGKLFTATAVMQLVEDGRIGLDADINDYLDLFQVPDTYPEPITVRHLLTHTSGLGEGILGLIAPAADQIVPLGQYLRARMPPRVRSPGVLANYSNYGMALAGYLVEARTGRPYAQYIKQQILEPLGMDGSWAELAPETAQTLATGYQYDAAEARHEPVQLVYLNAAPAGSMYATADDMARFMNAHLQRGRYGGATILTEATALSMQRRQFAHDQRLPGIGYAFVEYFANGHRILLHGGALQGYGSFLVLLPDQELGIFFSCNTFSPGVGDLFWQILDRFLDRYYPDRRAAVEPLVARPEELARVAGHYQSTRYPLHSLLKMVALIGQLEVEANAEGALTIHTPVIPGDGQWRLAGREPLLFAQEGSDEHIVFGEDKAGKVDYLYMQGFALERIPWYKTGTFHLGVLGFCVVAFVSAALGWPVGSIWRGWRGRSGTQRRGGVWARRLGGGVSALYLAFLVGLVLNQNILQLEIGFGVPPVIIVLLCLPLVGAGLTLPLLPLGLGVWRHRDWSLAARMHCALVVLASLLFLLFLFYWNLLGFYW